MRTLPSATVSAVCEIQQLSFMHAALTIRLCEEGFQLSTDKSQDHSSAIANTVKHLHTLHDSELTLPLTLKLMKLLVQHREALSIDSMKMLCHCCCRHEMLRDRRLPLELEDCIVQTLLSLSDQREIHNAVTTLFDTLPAQLAPLLWQCLLRGVDYKLIRPALISKFVQGLGQCSEDSFYPEVAMSLLDVMNAQLDLSSSVISDAAKTMLRMQVEKLMAVARRGALWQDVLQLLVHVTRKHSMRVSTHHAHTLIALSKIAERRQTISSSEQQQAKELVFLCASAVKEGRDAMELERHKEALRGSMRIFHMCGDYQFILTAHEDCPMMGMAWHVGDAAIKLGQIYRGFCLFDKFVVSTRKTFATGFPEHIRAVILNGVEQLGRECTESQIAQAFVAARRWLVPNVAPPLILQRLIDGALQDQLKVQAILRLAKQWGESLTHSLMKKVFVSFAHCGLFDETFVLIDSIVGQNSSKHYGLALEALANSNNARKASDFFRKRCGNLPAEAFTFNGVSTLEKVTSSSVRQKLSEIRQEHQRRREKRRRRAWECYGCNTWNPPSAKFCRACAAADVALWRCSNCSAFVPSTSAQCLVCDACRGDVALHVLRPWRCKSCGKHNSPHHAFYCSRCGLSSHLMSNVQPFLCEECGHENPAGIVRPWCSRCGALHPSASPDRTLWRCQNCCHLNPWVLGTCIGCRESHKPPEEEIIAVPWMQWPCKFCGSRCAPWQVVCPFCAAPRHNSDNPSG